MQNLELQSFVEISIPLGKGNRHLPRKLQLQILHQNKIRELEKIPNHQILHFCNEIYIWYPSMVE